MVQKRAQLVYSLYSKHFESIGEFEATLFNRFEAELEQNPLKDEISFYHKIEIPYTQEIELQMLKEYVKTISACGKAVWEEEGIKLNLFQDEIKNEKGEKIYKIELKYTLSLNMDLVSLFR